MDENTAGGGTIPPDENFKTSADQTVEKVEGAAKRTVLAGIGAVAVACDQANERFEQLVERGEQVREEWQGKADDIRQQNAGTRSRVRTYLRDAMDVVLNNFNMPSKGDIDTINVKLNILSRKLDEMNRGPLDDTMVVPPSGAVPPPPPPGDLST